MVDALRPARAETEDTHLARQSAETEQSPATPAPADRRPLLDLHRLSKSYGGVQALTAVTFDIRRGELFGLIGPNGSGKTTLLNVLSGLTPPTAGHFTFEGRKSSSSPAFRTAWPASNSLGRTFQGIRLIGDLGLLANVSLGSLARRSTGVLQQMLGTSRARKENAAFALEARRLLAKSGLITGTRSR